MSGADTGGTAHPDLVVVDEHDRPIGQAQFAEVRLKGLWHRAVLVLVFNSGGEFLLQKRGPHVVGPGLWDVSVGGHVDAGEDYLEAAKREAFEEIGLYDVTLELLGKDTVDEPGEGGNVRQFVSVYSALWDSELKADRGEVTELKWIPITELGVWLNQAPEDFFRSVRPVYNTYLEPKVLAEA